MSEPRVAIVGAGLSGLAAGIFARMNGYGVTVVERSGQPGGVSATWKRKGFVIDGGIHFFMGCAPGASSHALYRELGLWQPDQYLPMDLWSRFVDPAGGLKLDVTSDLAATAGALTALSPADARWIEGFMAAARSFRDADAFAGLDRPPELTGWWDTARMLAANRKTVRYFRGKWVLPVREAVREIVSPALREIVLHMFLPDVPLVFLVMCLGSLAGGQVRLRRDGSAGFARALEKRFLDLGGEVVYTSPVAEVLVRNGKAVGLRLESGDELPADRVISTADLGLTLTGLLNGRYMPEGMRRALDSWPLFAPPLMVTYGVQRNLAAEPHSWMFRADRPLSVGHLKHDWWMIRNFNYLEECAPEGRSVIQVMADSSWAPWQDLRRDMAAYRAEKETAAREVIERLDTLWPGISGQVEMTDVATPYTWWRYTGVREGSYEGFLFTPQALTAKVARTLPGLDHFYLAGQWTVPGGGVVPSMYTGRHAVMLLCRRDGRRFSAVQA